MLSFYLSLSTSSCTRANIDSIYVCSDELSATHFLGRNEVFAIDLLQMHSELWYFI